MGERERASLLLTILHWARESNHWARESNHWARESNGHGVSQRRYCAMVPAFSLCHMVPSQDSGAPPVHVDVIFGFDFPPACSCWARLPAVVLETVFGLIFRPPCLTAAYRKKAVYFGGLGFMSVSARSKHREERGLRVRTRKQRCMAVSCSRFAYTRAPVLSSQGRRHTHTHIHTHTSTHTSQQQPLMTWEMIFA